MASMNLKYQGIALTCLILGVGRIRKHYEGGERTDKDELLNGKPLYRYPAAFSSDGITCMGRRFFRIGPGHDQCRCPLAAASAVREDHGYLAVRCQIGSAGFPERIEKDQR